MSITIADVLKGLVEKVHGWGQAPDHLAAIDAHFGVKPGGPEPAEKAPAEKPGKA